LTAEEISKRYDDDNLPLTEGLIKRTYIRLITNVNERSEERKIYYKEYMDNGELGSDIKNTQEKNVYICNGSCTTDACTYGKNNSDIQDIYDDQKPPDRSKYNTDGEWYIDAHKWKKGVTTDEAKMTSEKSINKHCRLSMGDAGYGLCQKAILDGPRCRGPDEAQWENSVGSEEIIKLLEMFETPRNVTVSPDL